MRFQKERREQKKPRPANQPERRRSERGAKQGVLKRGDRFKSYFDHHKQVARESFVRLLGTPVSSLMTWLVIAIALTLPVGLYVFLQNAQQLSQQWDDAAQISVYLEQQLDASKARQLAEQLEGWPAVQQVRYISADEALEEFKRASGFGDALQYLDENPLPAVLVVLPRTGSASLEGTRALLEQLQELPGVEQAHLDLQWVDRLFRIMALGQRLALTLALLLGVAVLLVVGNTVRLAIESRRAEIVVVKLVGATDAFVRRPFLYTGVWYGLGGGLLAWLMVNLVMLWLSGAVTELVAAYNSEFSLAGLGILATLLLWLFSGALGLLGAWLAVGRHLSKIEPR
ncbi:MAG: permease-like cell division protein FtsX [Pseudomonadales bacterium]